MTRHNTSSLHSRAWASRARAARGLHGVCAAGDLYSKATHSTPQCQPSCESQRALEAHPTSLDLQWICAFGDVTAGLELDALSEFFGALRPVRRRGTRAINTEPHSCPVADVRGAILRKIAEFLEYRAQHPEHVIRLSMPLRERGDLRKSGCPEWYAAFIEALPDWPTVFELLEGADFMQVPELVDVAAARIASRVCRMDKAQKDAVFALPDGRELTPEEEARLREEYKWVREGGGEARSASP
jgi:hypothetical protein